MAPSARSSKAEGRLVAAPRSEALRDTSVVPRPGCSSSTTSSPSWLPTARRAPRAAAPAGWSDRCAAGSNPRTVLPADPTTSLTPIVPRSSTSRRSTSPCTRSPGCRLPSALATAVSLSPSVFERSVRKTRLVAASTVTTRGRTDCPSRKHSLGSSPGLRPRSAERMSPVMPPKKPTNTPKSLTPVTTPYARVPALASARQVMAGSSIFRSCFFKVSVTLRAAGSQDSTRADTFCPTLNLECAPTEPDSDMCIVGQTPLMLAVSFTSRPYSSTDATVPFTMSPTLTSA
mmetsp:Transcript_26878/g.67611  ORF Transcript_26878/g.67611 Transcript_26878/m.67611 type:complete len:288 (-) Transcript_26878:84-947(-)